MSFLEHLDELRTRLIKIIYGLIVGYRARLSQAARGDPAIVFVSVTLNAYDVPADLRGQPAIRLVPGTPRATWR